VYLEYAQFRWTLSVLELLTLVAFSDGKPVSTFPENAPIATRFPIRNLP
jgi:hypothetical protein